MQQQHQGQGLMGVQEAQVCAGVTAGGLIERQQPSQFMVCAVWYCAAVARVFAGKLSLITFQVSAVGALHASLSKSSHI
jgi:hypothetical protein